MTERARKVRALPLLAVALVLVVFAGVGCGSGSGSLKETCKSIGWQGRQCQALKGVEWAKKRGLPPNTVDGYYSLPEDER